MSQHTKEELTELILNNGNAFNELRAETDEEFDLTESHFNNCSLADLNLTNIDFAGSTFADSELSCVSFADCDLTSVDFTRASLIECDFSDSLLTGADMSYSTISYCNMTETDLAGATFNGADLTNTDLSSTDNLTACRFDEDTIWPDTDMLPDDFDGAYSGDLSMLKDDEDETQNQDY